MRGLSGKIFAGRWMLIAAAVIGSLLSSTLLVASATEEAVERAARRYRIQVFQTFRTERPEYDRRLTAGNQILKQWRSRGAPGDETSALIDWFTRATTASRPNTIDRLPPHGIPSSSPPSVTPDKNQTTPHRIHPPTRRPRTVRQPKRHRRDSDPMIAPSVPFLPQRNPDWMLPKAQRRPGEVAPLTWRLDTPLPLAGGEATGRLASPAPNALVPQTAATSNDLPKSRAVHLPEPATALRSPRTIAGRVRVQVPNSITVSPEQLASYPPHHEFPGFQSPMPSSAAPPANGQPAPVADVSVLTESSESPIDLAVLASRIRASNLRLSEIESELAESGLWDSQRLRPVVDRFDQMLSGRRLSQLYYDALDRQERESVTSFNPIRPTIQMLTQRLFEARVAAADDPVFFPPDSKEVSELKSMAQTIESWKNEIPENDH